MSCTPCGIGELCLVGSIPNPLLTIPLSELAPSSNFLPMRQSMEEGEEKEAKEEEEEEGREEINVREMQDMNRNRHTCM